jgi:hypothetical protein
LIALEVALELQNTEDVKILLHQDFKIKAELKKMIEDSITNAT